jgi:hypothetical protein
VNAISDQANLLCGLLSISLLTLTGCRSKNTNQINVVTPKATMITKEVPPLPKVVSVNTEVPVSQSSYCWGKLGCADYADGKSMLRGKKPTLID